jgi:hypothetical protein
LTFGVAPAPTAGGLFASAPGETVIFFSFKRSRQPRLLFHATILSNS